MSDEPNNQPTPADENHVIAERRAKLAVIRETAKAAGVNPFPNDSHPEDRAAELHAQYGERSKEDLEANRSPAVKVAGRMMLKRVMGKAGFATLQDSSGRIQLYLHLEGLGEAGLEAFKHYDLGDILEASGTMYKTNKGELSINCTALRLITKSLRPLPEKFHGLSDTEQRYRMRYVDLMVNPEVKRTFEARSLIVAEIRAFMVAAGYLEVETPMMHPIPGGAAAKPFITHHNTLDMQLYLRIAPELYLKRLVVGGFERVFEINRNFRNEGMSVRHNPEFTMMEFYIAYRDFHHLMQFTEEMIRSLSLKVCGTTTIDYQGLAIDFGKPFDRLTMPQAVKKYFPEYLDTNLDDFETLKTLCKKHHAQVKANDTVGTLQLKLFEETAEALLIQPTFIIDYPAEVSPLARRNDDNPDITDRFELFIAGRELANGFSELNDAEDQAARFMAQVEAKEGGDEEAMHYDADFVRALEYGMPPTAGEGIGIDRLVMLLTNSPSIRDVILFPQLRASDLAR